MLCGEASDVEVPATCKPRSLRASTGSPPARNGRLRAHQSSASVSSPLCWRASRRSGLVPAIEAEFIDQVRFTPSAGYAFRHPLIRTVAYESQLNSDRAKFHRRLATAIETQDSAEGNAAIIAEHLETAGDLLAAFDWHMRAATWSLPRFRRSTTQLAPGAACGRSAARQRSTTGGHAHRPPHAAVRAAARGGRSSSDPAFEELRDLCTAAGDQRSFAIGMAGMVTARLMNVQRREALDLTNDLIGSLTRSAIPRANCLVLPDDGVQARSRRDDEVLRLAQQAFDLAGGDPPRGNLVFGSPLALPSPCAASPA